MNFLFASFEMVTGLPEFIGYIFTFVFGAIVGSFLNVVIHRVPNEESIVFPNSACPKCKNPIKAYDNFPILSWLILGGKCRNCKEKIAARYPAVELLTAVLFVLTFWAIGFNAFLPICLIFVATMVSLIFIDAEHMILPNVINFPLLGLALLVRILYPLFFSSQDVLKYFPDLAHSPLTSLQTQPLWLVSLVGAVLGGLVGGGFLWLVGEAWKRLRGVDAMGLGDVKMMFAVGALLGWRLTLLTIFLGAFSGAVIGVFVVSRQKEKDMQTQIPFGIFLGIGAILALLFGEQLIGWYIKTFIPS
jgi:leader peptidase (prepilin peptidase)/N-methyltransferase